MTTAQSKETQPKSTPFNYVTANRFYVQIDEELAASFSECSGLGMKLQYDSHIEGGLNDQRRIVLGDPEFSDVTLKRGITDSLTFWQWMQSVLNEEANRRRNVGIMLFNQAGDTMQSWTLIGAVPVEWKVDSLQASSENVALESLTLAYEGLKIEGPKGSNGYQALSNGRDAVQHFSGKS